MKNVQNYEALNGGKEVIESKVLPKLCDMINSEIASGLVLNVGDLMQVLLSPSMPVLSAGVPTGYAKSAHTGSDVYGAVGQSSVSLGSIQTEPGCVRSYLPKQLLCNLAPKWNCSWTALHKHTKGEKVGYLQIT